MRRARISNNYIYRQIIYLQNLTSLTEAMKGSNKFVISHQAEIVDNSLIRKTQIEAELSRMRDDILTLNSAKEDVGSLNDTCRVLTRKSLKHESNKYSSGFMNKNKLGLRRVLEEQKVKNIVHNFRTKLKRNIVNSAPVSYQPFERVEDSGILKQKGFKIPAWLDLLHSLFSIALIFIIVFVYPLDIVFHKLMYDSQMFVIQIICIFFYLMEIVTNFISIKNIDGRKITLLNEIFLHYLKTKFPIDLFCFVILLLDVAAQSFVTQYLRLFVLVKVKQCLQKLQKIENLLINNFYKEQYWALAKVFIVNFAFAHCLATLLIAMSYLSPENNWLLKLNAMNAPWYQQYAWAYYWGCTIMLTVGFGDLAASNYKEAVCLTLIETFSCILLAYNINCVGNLINNIRQQDIQKNKNLKIMRRLAQENDITEELESKVCNYIDESDKMKKKFGFQAEKEFVSNLPSELKADFLKESNIKIFQNLRFFNNFTQKTLLALAQRIEVKIAHPQEIILKADNTAQFIILREGEVGYCTKKNGFQFNGTIVDLLKNSKNSTPIVLDLNFLCFQNSESKFQVKSLNYSMIYKITLSDFIETLRNCALDFEIFCESRDRSKHIIDEYQVLACQYCPTKHSKMKCPKLHYIPLKQIVIYKHLEEVKNGACERQFLNRISDRSQLNNPLKFRKHFKKLEQQIYRNNLGKTINKKQVSRYMDDDYDQMKKQMGSRNLDTSVKISYDEAKLALRLEKNALERIERFFVEKQAASLEGFWDMEADAIFNFKFYFVSFNGCELNLVLDFCSIKEKTMQNQQVLNALKTLKASRKFTNSL